MSHIDKIDYFGNTGIIIEDLGTLVTDRTALYTCSAVFSIKRNNWKQLPGLGAPHPIFVFIGMEHRELSFKGAYARATCNYAGIDNQVSDFTNPVYELSLGLSEEPISTHPDFITKIAGTPISPLHGAIFEKNIAGAITTARAGKKPPETSNNDYAFKEFSIILEGTSTQNPFGGVSAYLDAQMTWKKTYNGRVHPSNISAAGTIERPDGPAPALGGARNWLNMGTTSSQRGSAVSISQEWRSSGRHGWNKLIYG